MDLDPDACHRALRARDPRFDGLFVVGVVTTGIYCRPVCPARTPGLLRCRFFRLGAQAEREGFRACFRCRPELAPGTASVDAVRSLIDRALRRIDAGALDEGSVETLAEELSVTARHLRRALQRELGLTPVALAQSRRLALAKRLLTDTDLPLAQVAFASGFTSVRRFNASFRAQLRVAPSALRRRRAQPRSDLAPGIRLKLSYREPYAYDALLSFLAARAMTGVEEVSQDRYRRTVRVGDHTGFLEVSPAKGRYLTVELSRSLDGVIAPVAARLRAMFDLDAQPLAIAEALSEDRALASVIASVPGLRVPGAFDPFELAVRAVLGQQVSVKAASTLASRLVAAFADPIETPWPTLDRAPLEAARIASTGLDALRAIGLPASRANTIKTFAARFVDGSVTLRIGDDPEATRAHLLTIPGIGPWTVEYLAMRALKDPDAFPASDLVLKKQLGEMNERRVVARAEPWRPFRAYAAMTIWRSAS